ncbi:DUF1850 domain-containing protein [Hydrogenophaga sp.]|uniref:DUF1850 domain-containing protein n=1 Tax=Hydrogenophaga sp. TaxID=1904254 RepID=UPI002FC5B1FE
MADLGVCLVLAALAATPGHGPAFIATERFTLAWTHSIEKLRWEEDYAVVAAPGTAGRAELRALTARVRGSGAGMEPPPDAVLKDGWYGYTPAERAPAGLPLSRSGFVPDYELCMDGQCRPLSHWLASDGAVTLLTACRAPGKP